MAGAFHDLVVLLTQNCPLSCSHCVTDSGPWRRSTLDESMLQDLLAQAAVYGVKTVCFSGGEPFARYELLRRATRLARAHEIRPNVATSGYWASTRLRAVA